jgi:hypothetical protein
MRGTHPSEKATMKKTTLTALCALSHEGVMYGENMQFRATEEDAKRLVKAGQAVETPDEGRAHKEEDTAPVSGPAAASVNASRSTPARAGSK